MNVTTRGDDVTRVASCTTLPTTRKDLRRHVGKHGRSPGERLVDLETDAPATHAPFLVDAKKPFHRDELMA